MVNQSAPSLGLPGTNGTSTPNGLIKSNADSPATPASTAAAPSKPEKAAKPAPRLSIELTAEQLSSALGEKWEDYGRELNLFIIGKRTRMELVETLDAVLTDANLKKLHNNLLMGILANASRDPPPVNGSFLGWNRNKKRKEPMTGRGKVGSGKQKRMKMEIMALGPAERARIKNFKGINELDAVWSFVSCTNCRARRSCILLFRERCWSREERSKRHDYRKIRIFKLRVRFNLIWSRDTKFHWRQKRWNYHQQRIS